MFVSTSWLVAAGIETTCLVFSRMVAYSWGKMAFEQPNSNPSTPPFSTHPIHNFRLYLPFLFILLLLGALGGNSFPRNPSQLTDLEGNGNMGRRALRRIDPAIDLSPYLR